MGCPDEELQLHCMGFIENFSVTVERRLSTLIPKIG
jgi:hypothetical protein